MFSLKPLLFLLLLTMASHGVSNISPHQNQQPSTGVVGGGGSGVIPARVQRSVLEAGSNGENSSLILAKKRTRRKDPKNDFKYYTGGWNISNDRYISSVSFTAFPLYGIAATWFMGFGLFLLVIGCYYCRCRRKIPYGYSRTAYALSLAFLALFTIAAIVGCVILYTGQGKFHRSTTNLLGFIVRQSKDTVDNLNNVSDILATAKGLGVDQVSLPTDMKNNIDRVDKMINDAAKDLSNTKKNEKRIQDVLKSVRLALIIVAAVMLLVALLGFVFSIFGLQVLVYTLVVVGWILVTATFILCGIFLTLHNVMGDTCVAMDEWVQNPTARTALDDLLPCVDNATAKETVSQSKNVTFQLVEIVNKIVNNVANVEPPPLFGFLGYNQSGPLVPTLCNPLNPDKTDRKCEVGEVDASNATEVWKDYVCQVSTQDICTTVGRLTPKMYNQMSAAANVSSGLSNYGPFLAGLLDCSFFRYTFTHVHNDHCPGLTKYSQWVYIGLAMVSVAVMLSLVLWVLYARERRHRKYTKLAAVGSGRNSFATKRERE